MFYSVSPNITKPIVGCSADLSTENNLSDIDFIYNRYRAKKKELLMFFDNMDNLLAKELLKDVSTLIDNVSKIDSKLLKNLVDKV